MTEFPVDDDLMLAFGRGDGQAFEMLYERYRKPLYRYLYHAVGDRAMADDLYQDVWSRIIAARTRFRRSNGFRRWAFRIARNRLVDHWRGLGRQPATDAEALETQADLLDRTPEHLLESHQLAKRLYSALMQLPPEQREAFLLQREAGLSLDEIADHDGVGRETVKSRLRYAATRLKTLLNPRLEAAEK